MKMIKVGGREEYLSLTYIEKIGLVERDGEWESFVVVDHQHEILYRGTKEIAEKIHAIVISHVCEGGILDIQSIVDGCERHNKVEKELVNAIAKQEEDEREWINVYINRSRNRFYAVRVASNPHFDRVLYEVLTAMPVPDGKGGFMASKWYRPGARGKSLSRKHFITREDAEEYLAKEAKKRGLVLVKIRNQTETDPSLLNEN